MGREGFSFREEVVFLLWFKLKVDEMGLDEGKFVCLVLGRWGNFFRMICIFVWKLGNKIIS